ncbi:ATP-binding protein [Sphaerotilus montanus]|uniref:ATP-binding protein n=1 Tax=Sphaerotilus montanus TaxID=522889 RepID=UPI003FA2522F
MIDHEKIDVDLNEILGLCKKYLDGICLSYQVKERPDGEFISFEISNPSEKFYAIINKINDHIPCENKYKDKLSLIKRAKKSDDILLIPEVQLLQREISASLTVDKYTFGDEFLKRYTPSVTELEKQIVVSANHVVYGRRGSGKSSLLAYAMHHLKSESKPFSWIAMQTYAARKDFQVLASVLSEITRDLSHFSNRDQDFISISDELEKLGESDEASEVYSRLQKMTPRIKRMFGELSINSPVTIFLDDFHVVDLDIQPEILSILYAITRGNNGYIKLSGIEQLTNIWDGKKRKGLEPPHDIQTLELDHNLTQPDQSKGHIKNILDRHASYCGLSNIDSMANDEYMNRLVLSAAAVPRDALSLFLKSISKSISKRQRAVSITSLNSATSESIQEKLKDIERDAFSDEKARALPALEGIKNFCLNDKKISAFLVEISEKTQYYADIQKLIGLRFLHVLHKGITPYRAGERYIALMLDYGFYIGIRSARSIEIFPKNAESMITGDLRRLPILKNKK